MKEAKVDLGTCKRCGANMRKVRVNHTSAVKGDDNWDDVAACPNERCPEYVTDPYNPSVQEVVDTGMSSERIRDVVNGIAKGVRSRLDDGRGPRAFNEDVRTSLARIADALDYLVALSKQPSVRKL